MSTAVCELEGRQQQSSISDIPTRHVSQRGIGVPADTAPEELSLLTVEQLADRLNVSTKTISRWRNQGLVAQSF